MATLLDLFAIGFNSDSLKDFERNLKRNEQELKKYEKEVESLEKKLDELNNAAQKDEKAINATKTALEQAKERVKSFGDAVKTMQGQSEYQLVKLKQNFGSLTKTLGTLAIVGATVKKSIDFYEQGEQLDFLAQKAGIAVDKLQTLGNAAKRYGGSTESTAGTVENLRQQYQSLRMGEGGGGLEKAAFKYGVAISSNPEQMLENVARRMETLQSDAAKWDLAKTLGIDEGTTRLLIQGVEKYREELKRASKYQLYTKEDIERMREYRQIQGDIGMGIENIFGSIYRSLLPAIMTLTKTIRGVTDWLAEHEGAVKIIATLVGVAAAIGLVTTATKLWKGALALLAVNPVVAAITAVIVVIQDFITWLNGGESALEGLWNTGARIFDALKTKISDFMTTVRGLWDAIPEPIKKLLSMTNPITGGFTVATTAQQAIAEANNNRLNAVPLGAVANYNQTQAINENNNNNTQNINKANNAKNVVSIGTVNVQSNASDGRGLVRDLMNPLSDFDMGIIS